MRKLAWLAIGFLSACGIDPGERVDDPAGAGGDGTPPAAAQAGDADAGAGDADTGALAPYDRAIQKSVHNAYDKAEPLFDQLVWHRARSVELDIHVGRAGETAPAGDWFVYHEDYPFLRDTTCERFSDCLGQLAAFHAAVPAHEVVTLFVDLKDGFSTGHDVADLDAALASALGRDAIVAPADLLARCPGAASVRAAVTGACAFPRLADLHGKFVVATTGGTACDASSHVVAYAGADPTARVAFAAPNTDDGCPVASYDDKPGFVFFNMSLDQKARAAEVRARGLVARIYKGGIGGGLDSSSDFADAKSAGAELLATDEVNVDPSPWATTSTSTGFPFTCAGCEPPRAEDASLLAVRAASGDMWDAADSMYTALAEDAGAATWSAFVSVPSSHVEAWAKACLVARASDAPGAANVALCRPFDEHPPRLQVRAADGAATTAVELATPAGLTAETPAFLRLAVRPNGASTDAVAEASVDGRAWREVGRATVAAALPLRGVAVASHGTSPVRALFGDLTRADDAGTRAVTIADLTARKGVGASASGAATDGIGP